MSNIFATLLLAHLLADYPLQTNWMVQAKRTWPGLTLHVGIHLAVMLVLTAPSFAQSWPFLLMLAALHFAIDSLKNILACRRPHWVTGPYLFDQFLHLLAIGLVAALMAHAVPAGNPLIGYSWTVYAIGFVLVTYVWFITERIVVYANADYQREITAQKWTRMSARTLLLGIVVWAGHALPPIQAWSMLAVPLPYFSGTYGRRALLTDIVVVVGVAVLLYLVQW